MLSKEDLKAIEHRSTVTCVCAPHDIPALFTHIEAQRNALAKAEEDKAALVEALEECVDVMETTDDANMQKAIIEVLKQARTALARVKESPCPKN